MNVAFFVAGAVAIAATVMVITRRNAIHALLYLVVSFLAAAVVFYVLGAPFIAALEVIIYAGAIMVLFLFAVMLLGLGGAKDRRHSEFLRPRSWIGPAILVALLLAEMVWLLASQGDGGVLPATGVSARAVSPQEVGKALFGPYMLGAELASMLLLAGLVGAHRLTQREDEPSGGGNEALSRSTESRSRV